MKLKKKLSILTWHYIFWKDVLFACNKEQVIIIYSYSNIILDGQNVFIPYRESLMTLVLRDSLGGNCMTRMIATISMENKNVAETISTLKFA